MFYRKAEVEVEADGMRTAEHGAVNHGHGAVLLRVRRGRPHEVG
jgi:hypothetical protein